MSGGFGRYYVHALVPVGMPSGVSFSVAVPRIGDDFGPQSVRIVGVKGLVDGLNATEHGRPGRVRYIP
jgi:hypothetical protein